MLVMHDARVWDTEGTEEKKTKWKIKYKIDKHITKEKSTLVWIFSKLEKMAGDLNIKEVKLQLNNKIFKYVSLSQFKEVGNIELKNIKILLINRYFLNSSSTYTEKNIAKICLINWIFHLLLNSNYSFH